MLIRITNITKNAESPAIQSCMQGFICCGENEIRTRDTLLAYTRFPGVPLQPLEHLSLWVSGGKSNGYFWNVQASVKFTFQIFS